MRNHLGCLRAEQSRHIRIFSGRFGCRCTVREPALVGPISGEPLSPPMMTPSTWMRAIWLATPKRCLRRGGVFDQGEVLERSAVRPLAVNGDNAIDDTLQRASAGVYGPC